jgi:hypothetical protein
LSPPRFSVLLARPRARFDARSKLSLSLFTAFALIACSDGGGGSSLAALGIDDGASAGLSKSANASADKGVRISLETGALVEIPAGAVTKDVKVSMERPADGKALELVNRLPKAADRIASAPYVLTPHGTKFQSEVTIKLPLSKKDATAVSVAWLEDEDDTDWKVLASAQIEGDKAAVKLKHFSVLLLIEDASDLPRLDAGGVSTDEDGGESADDAGAARDATPPDDGEDAEIALEPDAGTEELDASTDEPDARAALDAGDDPLDAAIRADAQPAADASTGGDGAVPTGSLLAKLSQCGLVTQQGSLPEPELTDPISRCHYRCLLAGPCSDMEGFYCLNGDTTYTTETQACFGGCGPTFFVCPDQTQGYFQCNGLFECPNGEDEAACDPPYFQCPSGGRVPSYMRCDGVFDCQAGEDEQGCPGHVCDGDLMLQPDYVCDGFVDCLDGTDEPASCAVVTCSGAAQ